LNCIFFENPFWLMIDRLAWCYGKEVRLLIWNNWWWFCRHNIVQVQLCLLFLSFYVHAGSMVLWTAILVANICRNQNSSFLRMPGGYL